MQLKYHTVTIEDLVPKDHLPRKVEAMLDLSFVYEETAHLYSRNYGRPAIDPVVLVGKQRKKRTKVLKPKHPHRRVSRTDPDAGWLNRFCPSHGERPHPSVEFRGEHFQYDRASDCFRCLNGKELALTAVSRTAGSSLCWVYSASRADCQSCPMKERSERESKG